ncbi:co-chaperone YbbN [Streptomyces sp. NRRL S-87]|uniref:thioredoxin family protein n=1 Tax=Streptomyces sp. NRRL S-87 TaxID=1463920 RepID=UPI0004C26901|nr:thioredoxin domain-containing protein [Streptomyces sp. NRRL S-87]
MAAVGVHQALEDAEFDFVMAHVEGPVLAYFWGVWSEACKELEPVLRELAREYAGRLSLVRTDLVRCPTTTRRFEVKSAPTLVVIRDCKAVATATGPLTAAEVRALVEPYV